MLHHVFKSKKPIIGMIHLPPLPGYPKHPGMESVISKALIDLRTLEKSNFDGALVENDNDQPHQIGVSPEIANAFAMLVWELLKKARIPVGMEIIYDMVQTISIAHAVGAQFVRLDVFVDNVITQWGQITAHAGKLILLKKKIHADHLLLLTDIQVKHAKMLDSTTLEQSAKKAIHYQSNGLIITGNRTGHPASLSDVLRVKKIAGKIPILVGSGVNEQNVQELLQQSDGAIIGTSIKTGNYIDLKKAKRLIALIKRLDKNTSP